MDKKEEKALENKSKIQKSAEETLPGRQLGLYSKVDKKEVRNMVSEINPDKNLSLIHISLLLISLR